MRQAGVLAGVHAGAGARGRLLPFGAAQRTSSLTFRPIWRRWRGARGSVCCCPLRDHCLFRAGQHHCRRSPLTATAPDRRIFAGIDLAVNLLSLATQPLLTGHAPAAHASGTGVAAGALPGVYVIGFAALLCSRTATLRRRGGLAGGAAPLLLAAMNFALANPARQVFFTVLGREEKYKSKELDRCRYLSRL